MPRSKVISFKNYCSGTQTNTHIGSIALPGLLKWSVKNITCKPKSFTVKNQKLNGRPWHFYFSLDETGIPPEVQ